MAFNPAQRLLTGPGQLDLNDVHIKVTAENATTEENEEWIFVRIKLIHQSGLQFPISLFLKEVMSRCCLTFMQVSLNFVRTFLAVQALRGTGVISSRLSTVIQRSSAQGLPCWCPLFREQT